MNYKLKRVVLLLFGIALSCRLMASTADTGKYMSGPNGYRTWSIGVSGGIATPYTIFGSSQKQDFTSPDIQMGYDISVKDQISHSFGLQADFMGGKLEADHAAQLNSSNVPIYSRFDTKVSWSAALSGNFIFAHINGKNRKGLIQPYITLGVGLLNYTPQLHSYYSTDVLPVFAASSSVFIPVGLGLKFDLSRGVNLDLGYQVNFVGSDNLDGFVYGSNNDKFSYAHIGFEFAIGNHSKRQMATVSRATEMREQRIVRAKMQKDSADREQAALDAENAKRAKLKDSIDAINANLANIARLKMDSDGDGVPDVKDQCPNTPAGTKVDSVGCPIPEIKPVEVKIPVTDQDKVVVATAIKNIQFYSGTDVISQISFSGLNKLARLMISKKFSLKLDAYTDNTGKADANMKLSLARAEAVKSYLVNRGVDASEIEANGYGSAHPIASNKTPKGRLHNRRIEFSIN